MNTASINNLLAIVAVALPMIERGVLTLRELRRIFEEKGATADELAAMDARLSDAIDRREDEHGA